MIRAVEISKRAAKQLRKVPDHIRSNLMIWILAVEADGLEQVRRIRGYHDEPLQGDRAGQRSIRLSRSYRAIYEAGAAGSSSSPSKKPRSMSTREPHEQGQGKEE
jgi:proteic killer suppression protein